MVLELVLGLPWRGPCQDQRAFGRPSRHTAPTGMPVERDRTTATLEWTGTPAERDRTTAVLERTGTPVERDRTTSMLERTGTDRNACRTGQNNSHVGTDRNGQEHLWNGTEQQPCWNGQERTGTPAERDRTAKLERTGTDRNACRTGQNNIHVGTSAHLLSSSPIVSCIP